MTWRVTMFPWRIFYVGSELLYVAGGNLSGPVAALGTASDARAASTSAASPLAMHGTSFMFVTFGGVVGASVPVWRFDLSLELFAGLRWIQPLLEFNDQDAANRAAGGCWTSPNGKPECPSPNADSFTLARIEPRAGIGYRFSPWVSARAVVGFDALGQGAVNVLALIEFHNRSYDGFYPRRTAGR
jgi:hypothetical protein